MARRDDMWAGLAGFAAFRRANPSDDVTTALVTAVIDGRPLTDDEITGIMWNLVAGGLDTTTSLVSWGLHHLGTHPEQRARLIDDPGLIGAAVEEFLRHYSPSETLTRTATRDVELGGRQIRRGDVVFISWVAANHDPSVFDGAEELLIDRAVNKHLAFGLGGHRCIGSSIARIESAAHAGRRAGPHRRLRDRRRRLQALSGQPADDRRGVDAGQFHAPRPPRSSRPLRPPEAERIGGSPQGLSKGVKRGRGPSGP